VRGTRDEPAGLSLDPGRLILPGLALSLWTRGTSATHAEPAACMQKKSPYEGGGEVVWLWWQRIAFSG
jgi:hypothetical protein